MKHYRRARAFLRDAAPWMRVMDALSDLRYGREGLTDVPIPSIHTAPEFRAAGIPHSVYFCCGPRGTHLQRQLDTPLVAIRISGWLFHRLEARGFLHWGYNYWHALEQERLIDPFRDATAERWPEIPPGDPFVVYPGPDGPLDSVRWEVFAESLQDYALLHGSDVARDDPLLQPIRDYADFPRSEGWLDQATARLLRDRP